MVELTAIGKFIFAEGHIHPFPHHHHHTPVHSPPFLHIRFVRNRFMWHFLRLKGRCHFNPSRRLRRRERQTTERKRKRILHLKKLCSIRVMVQDYRETFNERGMNLIDLIYHASVPQPRFILNSLRLLYFPAFSVPFLSCSVVIYTHYMDKRIETYWCFN